MTQATVMDFENGNCKWQDDTEENLTRQINMDERKMKTDKRKENICDFDKILDKEVEKLKQELRIFKMKNLVTSSPHSRVSDLLSEEVNALMIELSNTKMSCKSEVNGNTKHHYKPVVNDTTDAKWELIDSLVPDISVPVLIPTRAHRISDELHGLKKCEILSESSLDHHGTYSTTSQQETITATYGIATCCPFQEISLTVLHFTNWRNVQVSSDIQCQPPGYFCGLYCIASKKRKKIVLP